MSLGFWAIFGLLPGAYLIARNRALAIYLFREQSQETLDVGSLVTALICVLGVYLVIKGAGAAVGGLFLVTVLYEFPSETTAKPIGGIITALLLAAAGIFLAARAHAVARFLCRPSS
jgi:hypothetical protein